MTDTKPNTFIVGAAKSATTSLSAYLGQHPDVFVSAPKEPKFWSRRYTAFPHNGPGDEHVDRMKLPFATRERYFELFHTAAEVPVVIDASADNLYYFKTAPDIKQTCPDARIIISLRDPCDRAFSAYTHMVRDGRERETFPRGLELEKRRMAANYEFLWHYYHVGLYHDQVRAFLDTFGTDRVKVVLYDEIQSSMSDVLDRLCEFLAIDAHTFETGRKHNTSGVPRWKWLHRFFVDRSAAKEMVKPWVPAGLRRSTKKAMVRRNLGASKLDGEMRGHLIERYSENIMRLEDLIGRDLSDWRRTDGPTRRQDQPAAA